MAFADLAIQIRWAMRDALKLLSVHESTQRRAVTADISTDVQAGHKPLLADQSGTLNFVRRPATRHRKFAGLV
jgi:hypothetical protein